MRAYDAPASAADVAKANEAKTAAPTIDDVLGVHVPVFVKAADTASNAPATKTTKEKVEKAPKEPAGPTKADKAREIYTRMAGQPRQDILKAFQTEAGLTEAGSATYFANCKRAAARAK